MFTLCRHAQRQTHDVFAHTNRHTPHTQMHTHTHTHTCKQTCTHAHPQIHIQTHYKESGASWLAAEWRGWHTSYTCVSHPALWKHPAMCVCVCVSAGRHTVKSMFICLSLIPNSCRGTRGPGPCDCSRSPNSALSLPPYLYLFNPCHHHSIHRLLYSMIHCFTHQ